LKLFFGKDEKLKEKKNKILSKNTGLKLNGHERLEESLENI